MGIQGGEPLAVELVLVEAGEVLELRAVAEEVLEYITAAEEVGVIGTEPEDGPGTGKFERPLALTEENCINKLVREVELNG